MASEEVEAPLTTGIQLDESGRDSNAQASSMLSEPWDDSALLEHIKQPLVFEFNPLQGVLQEFHTRIHLMAKQQAQMLTEMQTAMDTLQQRLNSEPEPAPPAPFDPPPEPNVSQTAPELDGRTKEMLARLNQFADAVESTSGLQHIQLLAASVSNSGGAAAFSANLGTFCDLTQMAGGSDQLHRLLSGVKHLLSESGGAGELLASMRLTQQLCKDAGGPAELCGLLHATKELLNVAGGAAEFTNLLKTVKDLSDAAGGASPLHDLLKLVAGLSESAGGIDSLIGLLTACEGFLSASDGAENAVHLMKEVSDVVKAAGGSAAFMKVLQSFHAILSALGGSDALAQLFVSLQLLVEGAGGVEALLTKLAGSDTSSVGLTPEQLQLLTDMDGRVKSLESDVSGFEKSIDDLRAAGRIEAMEDVVSNLMSELAQAEEARSKAAEEAKALRLKELNSRSSSMVLGTSSRKQASHANLDVPKAAAGTPNSNRASAIGPDVHEAPTDTLPNQDALAAEASWDGAASQAPKGSADNTQNRTKSAASAPTPQYADLQRVGSEIGKESTAPALSARDDDAASPQITIPSASPACDTSPKPESALARRTSSPRSIASSPQAPSAARSAKSSRVSFGVTQASSGVSKAEIALPVTEESQDASDAAGETSEEAAIGLPLLLASASPRSPREPVVEISAASEPAAGDDPCKPGLRGLFKKSAEKVIAEQSLGKMKRFASQALTDTLDKVERPMAEVLKRLTTMSAQRSAVEGVSQEEFDVLVARVDDALDLVTGLPEAVEQLTEEKADKTQITHVLQLITDLWRAVKALQAPSGDEGRGMKNVKAQCISCDRQLNIARDDTKLGDLPVTAEPFGGSNAGPKGPGWESAPKRSLANGDMRTYRALTANTRRGRSPPRNPEDPWVSGQRSPSPGKPAAESATLIAARPQTSPATSSPYADQLFAKKLDKARAERISQLQDQKQVNFHSSPIRATSIMRSRHG